MSERSRWSAAAWVAIGFAGTYALGVVPDLLEPAAATIASSATHVIGATAAGELLALGLRIALISWILRKTEDPGAPPPSVGVAVAVFGLILFRYAAATVGSMFTLMWTGASLGIDALAEVSTNIQIVRASSQVAHLAVLGWLLIAVARRAARAARPPSEF